MTRCRPSRSAGFTLVETLVALFILALVASAGASLLIGATGAGKQVREREDVTRQLDLAQRLIRQDMAAISTRRVYSAGTLSPPEGLYGETPRDTRAFLRFVRSGWINPGLRDARGPLQLVEYSLVDGALVRQVTQRPDATAGTPVSQRILLDGIASIDLSFWRGDQASDAWTSVDAQSENVLPDRVEFRIHLQRGGDLVIAALSGGR